MVWIRYGKIRAIWRCTTARGYETRYHAVGVSLKDEYVKKPEEDLEIWANRLGDFVARKMCRNACGSLSTSVYCDEGSVQSEIVYTSEMLVAKPGIKKEERLIEKEEEIIEEIKKVEIKVPKFVLEQLGTLEKRLSELEKRKSEIGSYIAMAKGAIERIKESGAIEKLPGQEEALRRLVGELTRQNIIIGRQKAAIDKLKGQYYLQ